MTSIVQISTLLAVFLQPLLDLYRTNLQWQPSHGEVLNLLASVSIGHRPWLKLLPGVSERHGGEALLLWAAAKRRLGTPGQDGAHLYKILPTDAFSPTCSDPDQLSDAVFLPALLSYVNIKCLTCGVVWQCWYLWVFCSLMFFQCSPISAWALQHKRGHSPMF